MPTQQLNQHIEQDEAAFAKSERVIGKQNEADANLVRFIEILQSIDTTAPLAKLNATSMPDNNGGRIKF
jgi:hypothetical protein